MKGSGSKVREHPRGWAEMAPDVLGLIFDRLSVEEKLHLIARVCKPWRHVAEGAYCWEKTEKIDIDGLVTRDKRKTGLHLSLLRVLLTRNARCFTDLYVSRIANPHLSFIAHRARSLRVLSVKSSSITDSMVEQVAPELSSLTAIDLSHCHGITACSLATIGANCASLESLTWDVRTRWCPYCGFIDFPRQDDVVRDIPWNMPNLKRLSMAYININAKAAHRILSGCPALEWLNVKGCWRICFALGEMEHKYPKLKVVRVHHEDPGDHDDEWGSIPCKLSLKLKGWCPLKRLPNIRRNNIESSKCRRL